MGSVSWALFAWIRLQTQEKKSLHFTMQPLAYGNGSYKKG